MLSTTDPILFFPLDENSDRAYSLRECVIDIHRQQNDSTLNPYALSKELIKQISSEYGVEFIDHYGKLFVAVNETQMSFILLKFSTRNNNG